MTASASTSSITHEAGSTASRTMRTGILMHPSSASSGRLLILPHPRTCVPTYYLSSPPNPSCGGELYELATLADTKHDRAWMISRLNQVVSSGQLDILSRVDARFLVAALLGVLGGDVYRSREDTFEQIALVLQSRRREAVEAAVPELKARPGEGAESAEEGGTEWSDIVAFGNLPLVRRALEDVADVQDLPNGDQAYRLSLPKTFGLLDAKHTALSQQSTFAAAPNTLGRSFERAWPLDSDPSPYLSTSTDDAKDCKEAQQLRSKIAAEIIATLLPPGLAVEYFAHLKIAV